MIKIENVEVVGWEHAIRGMRNPKNSWDRIDSEFTTNGDNCGTDCPCDCPLDVPNIGDNDLDLMTKLAKGGPVHAKYRRMIVVYLDITAPLYWWKEFDTYKVGTVANSCSTMHKIHEKEFVLDDFSHNKLFYANFLSKEEWIDGDFDYSSISILKTVIEHLNKCRNQYNIAEEKLNRKDLMDAEREHIAAQKKFYWWQMIQLLPSSYNQKRTIMLNYEVLVGIYKWRHNHKLDEWVEFCKWIKTLPCSEIITGSEKEMICNE